MLIIKNCPVTVFHMSGQGFTAVTVCSKEVRSGLVICLAQNDEGDKKERKKGEEKAHCFF